MKGLSIFNYLKGGHDAPSKPSDDEAKCPLIQNPVDSSQANIQSNIPYNPKLYPPNILQCEQHAHARRVSIPEHLYERMMGPSQKNEAINICDCFGSPVENRSIRAPQKNEAIDVCDCCGYPVENRLINLCCPTKDLLFLGPGFPLFFEFMKYGIFMLFMIMLFAGLYNISTNIESDDCKKGLKIHDKPCQYDYFVETSLVNKAFHEQYLRTQEILNLISVLFCIFFMHVLRYKQRKLAFECDLSIITASDYTLQIGNLPTKPKNLDESKLIEYIENIRTKNNEPIKVVKLNMSYIINEFVSLLNEQVELSDKLLSRKSIIEHNQNELKEIKDEKEQKNIQKHLDQLFDFQQKDEKQLKEVEEKIENKEKNFKTTCHFTGIAFMTFETPLQAQLVKQFFKLSTLDGFKRSFNKGFNRESKYLFEGCAISVKRAPEPNEVSWENLEISDRYRLQRQIFNWFFTFVCLFLSFVMITLIFYLQMYMYENSDSSVLKRIISYVGCILIVIINMALVSIVTYLTRNEKLENVTDYETSLTQKKTAALFINTACIYLLVAFWTNSFFGSNGLIYNIFSVFGSYMIMQPLLFIFSPSYIYKLWQKRKIIKDPKAYNKIQPEANKIFEGDNFEITVCYAVVLNMMLFAAFYAPLLPLSLFFAITTLIIFYWTFKCILLRRCCTPTFLGKEIAYEAIEIMEFVPLFLAIGDVFFNLIFYGQSGFITYVTVGISIFNFMFPMGWLNKQIMPFEEKKKSRLEDPSNTMPYSEARIDFNEEYDRSNPMTHEKSNEEWIRFKERRETIIKEVSEVDDNGEKKEKVKKGGIRKKMEEKTEPMLNSEDEIGGLKKYIQKNPMQKKGKTYTFSKVFK